MALTASLPRADDCCRTSSGEGGIPAILLSRIGPVRPAAPAPVTLPAPTRQRSRLWELNDSIHCSIIGTCLTTGELRRVMAKIVQTDIAGFSDHDLHAKAVGLCNHRNPASKLLQKALDQRHETVIKRFGKLRGEAAVLEAWGEYRRAGDIPGAYWAVLTHPDVGHTGLCKAFGDVHMLSHLVGAANRADIRRLTVLEEENAALRAKVDRQQVRLHDAVASRDETIRRLGALAAGHIKAAACEANDDALAAMRHLVADLQSRLDREASRRERLEQRAKEGMEASRAAEARANAAEAALAAAERELAALERHQEFANSDAVLPPSRVLYVGGRPSAIEQMRTLLAEVGGGLLVHDGGRHDHPSLLAGLIGQADIVVFPVDCVSHDAALTVKRLCRQQSKPWAPLRSSGLGAFLATLAAPHPLQETSP